MSNLNPGTHSFTVGGTRLVYHVAGRGPLMINQSGGPGAEYSYLRNPLLERHFTMVYPELPGTGGSGPLPAGATYVDTYVDFLHALIDHLAVARAYVLGHSHGGFIAQRFAIRHPERVAGLALYDTAPARNGEFSDLLTGGIARYAVRHAGNPEAAAVLAAFGGFGTAETDEQVTEVMRGCLPIYFADYFGRRDEFKALRDGIRGWYVTFDGTEFDYRPHLSSITAPTVVIVGRHDFIADPVWAEALHRGIAGSKLVVVEKSGHFGSFEEPEKFRDAVLWLLRDDSDR